MVTAAYCWLAYSEAYLGQKLDPYFQDDKAAGLIDYDDAVFMFQNLTIKLNELNYYYGAKVSLQNSADTGQTITLAGYTEDGQDATAEMDYVIVDACTYLGLPQPPMSCALTPKTPGKFIEKVLDCIATGVGMPQFVNADVMVERALHLWGPDGLSLEKSRRTAIGACVGSYLPLVDEDGRPFGIIGSRDLINHFGSLAINGEEQVELLLR